MLTDEPTAPLVEFKIIEGVTVNVALAVLFPSVAVTCLAPAESMVVLNVAEKLPAAVAFTWAGLVAIRFPSNLTVIVELGS